jgi:hypothetical protein
LKAFLGVEALSHFGWREQILLSLPFLHAAAACNLGVVEQTLGNWVKAHRAGALKDASGKPLVTAGLMENSCRIVPLAPTATAQAPALQSS